MGNAESGFVASLISVRFSIVSGGVLCVLGCLASALLLPGFRAYRAQTTQPAPREQELCV